MKNKGGTDKVMLNLGFVVKDEVFTGGTLQNAIGVSVGSCVDGVFTASNATLSEHRIP